MSKEFIFHNFRCFCSKIIAIIQLKTINRLGMHSVFDSYVDTKLYGYTSQILLALLFGRRGLLWETNMFSQSVRFFIMPRLINSGSLPPSRIAVLLQSYFGNLTSITRPALFILQQQSTYIYGSRRLLVGRQSSAQSVAAAAAKCSRTIIQL